MSPYRRNVMVGIVVLGGLITLGWMMTQFGGKLVSPFAQRTIPVRFISSRADGLGNGSPITFRGVNAGHVDRVTRGEDQLSVYIDASLDIKPPLPSNIDALIRTTGLVGSAATIVLELKDPVPSGELQARQEIPAKFVGLDIIPAELPDLVHELRLSVAQFRESQVIPHINEQVARAGELIASAKTLIADPELKKNLEASLANIRDTTEHAKHIAERLESVSGDVTSLTKNTSDAVASISRQTNDRLVQISKILEQMQTIVEKVNNGQGTAGALVNDPRLYQSLVDSSREINVTVAELKRLIEQWEQEGVALKLK